MTDLEKILIRSYVNLIKDIIKDQNLNKMDWHESNIAKIIDKSTNPIGKYINNKNDFTEYCLGDIFTDYIYNENYTYKDVIELFQGLEDKNYD